MRQGTEDDRRMVMAISGLMKKRKLYVAKAYEKNVSTIRKENEADVADAEVAGYEKSLISHLTLKPEKISSLAKSVRMLADMEEPVGQILKRIVVKSINHFLLFEGAS